MALPPAPITDRYGQGSKGRPVATVHFLFISPEKCSIQRAVEGSGGQFLLGLGGQKERQHNMQPIKKNFFFF